MTAPSSRRGFTLVELLVVTGLIAALFGLLVTGMRPSGSSQVRSFSQLVSSAILVAQSRAIGNDLGSALVIVPGTGNIPVVAANAVFNADLPPLITGSVAPPLSTSGTFDIPPNVLISGSTVLRLSATSTVASLVPNNSDPSDMADGYKIRFSGASPFILPTGPWMNFAFISFTSSTCSATVSLRPSANQTVDNLIWPIRSSIATLQFEVARYPVQSTSALDTQQLAAIDLRYSGIGDAMTGSYGTLDGKGSITVTFNRTGGFDSVMQSGTTAVPTIPPLTPTAPLYLLLSSVANIQAGLSLASADSRWLVIAPGTGRMTIASNVAVLGSTLADVFNARANARQGIVGGGQ
jgi:prepilin-type N-terminal cleavage/methylation domain-containing protein